MSPGDELFSAVSARLARTDYVVERTSDGFVVRLDLTGRAGYALRDRVRVVQNHVVLDEDLRVLTIVDDHVQLSARSDDRLGPSSFGSTGGGRLTRQTGRVREVSFRRTWDPRRPRGQRIVEEERYDSAEAHALIREVAAAEDWVESGPGEGPRPAVVAAVVGTTALLVTGLVVTLVLVGT